MREADEWEVRGRVLDTHRPLVMGVLNVTPDSFSDGGRFVGRDAALRRAELLAREGADIVDVGGESTRPGARPVPVGEELRRMLPVLDDLQGRLDVPVSVDTRRAAVAREALAMGAHIVNDVSALADADMPAVVRDSGAGLVLMHMRGTPETMQRNLEYHDVVAEVVSALHAALERAEAAGIPRRRMVLDPGIGFAKAGTQNLRLIANSRALRALGRPVLLGPGRKSFLGALMGGAPPDRRLMGTVAACVTGFLYGARIFRVHDVAAVRQALDVAHAISEAGSFRQQAAVPC